MSQERDITTLTGIEPNPKTPEITKIEEDAKTRRARLASILSRGVVHDQLKVDLPPHLHGEWARNDPVSLDYMRTLGFEIDREFAPKRSMHANGSGNEAVVGDVIFMTCPKEVKEDIDAIRLDQFYKINGKPGEQQTREEREFAARTKAETGGDIPTIIESKTTPATVQNIKSALDAANEQTKF